MPYMQRFNSYTIYSLIVMNKVTSISYFSNLFNILIININTLIIANNCNVKWSRLCEKQINYNSYNKCFLSI